MERKRVFMISALMALAVMLTQAQEVKVPLRFDFYYTYEKMNEADLRSLNMPILNSRSLRRWAGRKGKSHHGTDNQ
ncbi:MAG: hypothetical protein R2758_08235 [Bacteroidales bacterium]